MNSRIVAISLFMAATASPGQGTTVPQATGYVTRFTSPSDFDVNGQAVRLADDASFTISRSPAPNAKEVQTPVSFDSVQLYLGEPVDLFGQVNRKAHTISANRIVLHARSPHQVSGSAIIDAVLPVSSPLPSGSRLVRADGYPVLITTATKVRLDKSIASLSDVGTNVWIAFYGTQHTDGIVEADAAYFIRNAVKNTEDNLRKSSEYDPSAVPDVSKQSGTSKFFRGVDVRQIPPSKDTAMQARVSAIGLKLIPKYQSALPPTEPTRINFRFQVIDDTKDTDKWHDALTLPNGIILVPHRVVERLQNDSQLATVLADNIACALEKLPLQAHLLNEKLTAIQLAADVGGIVVPFLGIAPIFPNKSLTNHELHVTEDQSGRVSLWLLHDAGFDVSQAPITWWLLSAKEDKTPPETPLPRRAANLYQFLGSTWPMEAAATPPASHPAAPR